MKILTILSILALFVGCNSTETTQIVSNSYNGPKKWNVAAFPINLQISNDYTGTETTLISDMGIAWEDSISNRIDFFDLSNRVNELVTTNADDFGDNTYGFYKSQNWPTEFSNGALAVTQIYLSQFTDGQIAHADIIVNYDNYTFRTGLTGSGYDLGTVALHEMGHFIGLDHSATESQGFNRADAVMYPAIGTSENKRVPQTWDQDQLNTKYPSTSSSSLALRPYSPEDPKEATAIIVMELFPDGKCVHRQDGKIIGHHKNKALKKHQ